MVLEGILAQVVQAVTTVITVAIEWGKWVLDQVYRGIKGSGNFIITNFKYDNPLHIAFLFGIFMFLISILIVLILAGASVGSNGIAGSTADNGQGYLFNGTNYGTGDMGTGSSPGTGSGSGTSPNTATNLCGNNFCDKIQTTARYSDAAFLTSTSCSAGKVWYNIPHYCQVAAVKTYVNFDGNTVFENAYCADGNFYDSMSGYCVIDGSSIWYIETAENCPYDCHNSDPECIVNLVCSETGGVCPDGYLCCPSGTDAAGRCMWSDLFGSQNEYDPAYYAQMVALSCSAENQIIDTIASLRETHFNCPCNVTADCVGDIGGSTCCGIGTYHEGYCYSDYYCDEPGV